ncbi:MAG: outer membrane protein assembly factor BamD [Chthoniobacteraceae bacterium]
MKKAVLSLALSLAALAMPAAVDAAVVFTSREGWTAEGDPATEAAPAELMRKAEEQEAAGQLSAALGTYKQIVKRHPVSIFAGKSQRKVGRILEAAGEYDSAYEAYTLYLTKYPKGEDFEGVVESMFNIAKLFLEGEKKKILGVKIASSMERAQQMFEGIVRRAPFSKWAPLSQFNAGQALEKMGKYSEAIAAYSVVVSKYPADDVADDAQYQIGYVRLKQYREGSYDQAGAQKAREAFEDFINRYPESEKVAQAQENMKALEGGSTKGTLDVAKFYDKTKQFKAAVIYYNDVIKAAPDTPEATFAKTRIEELRTKYGEDALRAGPERAETGQKAAVRRKLQAKVETASRPDYVGPPVNMPAPDEVAPGRPKLRGSPIAPVPAVEPDLPKGGEPKKDQ